MQTVSELVKSTFTCPGPTFSPISYNNSLSGVKFAKKNIEEGIGITICQSCRGYFLRGHNRFFCQTSMRLSHTYPHAFSSFIIYFPIIDESLLLRVRMVATPLTLKYIKRATFIVWSLFLLVRSNKNTINRVWKSDTSSHIERPSRHDNCKGRPKKYTK